MRPVVVIFFVGAVFGAIYGSRLVIDKWKDMRAAVSVAAVELTRERFVAEVSRLVVHLLFLGTVGLVQIPALEQWRNATAWILAIGPWVLVASSWYSDRTKSKLLASNIIKGGS